MPRCVTCSTPIPGSGRFCPACGTAVSGASRAPTRVASGGRPSGAPPPASPTTGRLAADRSGAWRFQPGAVLAGRFRIVGLLGRGGMGEVYRADDLKLGQPVALKMLPEALAGDADLMARFFNEVSVARQVAHPNVCRVYDVAEADGLHFLSMELVDGEDLGSLLRRIGRLPRDKAVQLARQLCAGLAAMHDRGVLHRDLKPANVMIDGRGAVRITDFGLAGLAADLAHGDVRAGTPAYMPPEQIAGREVTVRGDLYSLGLVLYEMFTGRAVYDGPTLAEMRRLHEETRPPAPSSILEQIDPAVERAILHCLEKDPHDRPASALAVAAALPGGDPLAAALQAGETPSPEMVAAAGAGVGLSPRAALACLAGAIAGLGVIAWLHGQAALYRQVVLEKPPVALAEAARSLVHLAGYTDPPAGVEYAFAEDSDYLRWLERSDASPRWWDRLAAGRPPAILFWYRQSPRPLATLAHNGNVSRVDPPLRLSGMVDVQLDTRGRLIYLAAVPPQVEEEAGSAADPAWGQILHAAGLDPAGLAPAVPSWTPPAYADARTAWEVPADLYGAPARVEAASHRGRPVYFQIVGPWTRPDRMREFDLGARLRAVQWTAIGLVLGLLLGAILLARHNLRLGRGDRRGALRLSLFVFLVFMALWALRARHVPTVAEFAYLVVASGRALFIGCLVWLLYVALEPYVRRRWPSSLITWNRLLAGRYRDPLVGRDLLIGAGAGCALAILSLLGPALHRWLGLVPPRPAAVNLDALRGAHFLAANLLSAPIAGIASGLSYLFLLLLLRVILRRQWLASLAWLAIPAALGVLAESGSALIVGPLSVLGAVLVLVLYLRAGLFAAIVALWFANIAFLAALDLASWYAGLSLFALLSSAAVALFGFSSALAGRPLLAPAALEA